MIPYGRFEPDKGELEPGICVVADGVLPQPFGFGPSPDLTIAATATALPATCVGAVSIVLNDGTWQVIGFTAAEVYKLQSDYTWDALSASLNVTAGDHVPAFKFGNNLLFTNTTDGLIYYNLETPAGFTEATQAGKPRFIFTAANMVFGLDCLDSSSNRDNRLIRNSDFNSFTDWTNGAADYQPLEDGGPLLWGCDLQDGGALVLQERAVRFIQFGGAGGGALYSLRKLADGLGSVGARSCANYSGMAFWLATDGFCKFSRGGGIERIGAGRVDEWFFGQTDQGALNTIQAEIDPFKKIVWWRYKHVDVVSETIFEDMIGYSFQFDCWVTSSVSTAWLANIATPGVTLDDLDALYGILDDIDIPLDSRAFQGGQPVFGALNSALKFGTFTGANQAAILRTSTGNSPVSGLINRATGLDDCATGTLELGVKDGPEDSITWKTGASRGEAGRFPLRGRGMNIAFRRNFPAAGEWSYARGVDHIKGSSGGPR